MTNRTDTEKLAREFTRPELNTLRLLAREAIQGHESRVRQLENETLPWADPELQAQLLEEARLRLRQCREARHALR
jgi:hypothetical protein